MCGGGGGSKAPVAKKAVAPAKKKAPAKKVASAPSVAPASGNSGNTPAAGNTGSFFDSSSSSATNQSSSSSPDTSSQSQQFISSQGGDARSDRSAQKFIPGSGETGRDALAEALGGLDVTVMTGKSPFRHHRRQFLEKDFKANPEVPGQDAVVEDQANVQGMISASAQGEGAQGFGQRALAGDEAAIVATDATQSNAVETGLPAEIAQSDLQMDPNYVAPSPGKIYVGDQAYNVPVMGQENTAFAPNSREAFMRAAGPLSRGLMSARSGYGRRFL